MIAVTAGQINLIRRVLYYLRALHQIALRTSAHQIALT